MIAIDAALAAAAPGLALGWLRSDVEGSSENADLWCEIESSSSRVSESLAVEDIASLQPIAAQRAAYKACGKDPRRYRGSAEALLRRIVQGKKLYQVNTLVDINNLLSLESQHPVGSYDRSALQPPLTLRIGAAGEEYQGIGKGRVNLAGLPLLADARGAVGSPTSDSERAAIGPNTDRTLLVVYAFSGSAGLEATLRRASELLTRYAAADSVELGSVSC